MDELILRSLEGDTSEDEERTLAEWRVASPDNESRYRQLAKLSSALEAGRRPSLRATRPTSAEVLRRHSRSRSARWARLRGWIAPAAAIAATLVMALVAYSALRRSRGP